MAGEMEYVNPIIHAMIAAHQINQQRAHLQQQVQQAKDTKEFREHQLDQQLKQIEYDHQHHQDTLKIQQEAQGLMAKQARANAVREANEFAIKGGNPQAMLGELAPELGAQDFSNPQQEATRLASQAGQVTGAQTTAHMEAAQPFEIKAEERAFTNKKILQDQENTFKSNLVDKELASHKEIAKLGRDTQIAIANGTNAMHLQIAGMQYVPTPDAMRGMFVAGATGSAKLNYANPQERAALGSIHQMGGREVDPKELQALKEGQAIIPLFDQLEEFAKKLPSNRLAAFVKGRRLAAAQAIGWNTHEKTELDKIGSKALLIGRSVEGMTGRPLAKQLELDLNSLVAGNLTVEDAREKIENLRQMFTTKQEDVVMGGLPDWQKELIYKTHGIKPASELNKSTVQMRAPTGEVMAVPKSQVEHYKSQGAKVVE